jgi:ribonuclease Y
MNGVWYAAIGAVFVLGLLFVGAYSRRGSNGKHTVLDAGTDSAIRNAEQQIATDSALRMAESEAASVRLAAQSDADAARRAAETEAAAIRRAAQVDAQALQSEAEAIRKSAQVRADELLADSARRADAEVARLTLDVQRRESELDAMANRAALTQADLDRRGAKLAADSADVEIAGRQLAARRTDLDVLSAELNDRESDLTRRYADLTQRHTELSEQLAEQVRALEHVAGLTSEQAKAELLAAVETGARRDAAVLVRTIENEARSQGTERARAIVAEAVQRVASEQTTESVVSVQHLPSDEMKGRIIGREGRNVRSFESITGVNLIIDDTPEAVLLSCFDPVRREIGRLTLEKLVGDGRIHPHRIEEVYEQSKAEVDELCLRAARDAIAEVGVGEIDDRLLPTIGRLKYRTSYGQNVLGHLIETAHIAGIMAAELGVEPILVKRCAFLHDIGKALTHEVEGSHAIVGADLLRRIGESEAVAHAVEAHHNEVQPRTVEAVLTQASDTCSAARPGARRESLESYVKRLQRIEEIASAKQGVEKVFAMQAGREVRVMVQPTEVDDLAAQVIAREIAKQIEDELTYPGQIRVTVVRELRSTEIAH